MFDYALPFADALWVDVLPRDAVCPQLRPLELLHAGPPLRGAAPAPIRNAAAQALMFEGRAADQAAALTLLASGEATLRPAQDFGIVTPLAQVVSASMLLAVVRQRDALKCAPLVEGPAPALRFGSTDPGCLERLRALGTWASATIAPRLRRAPIAIADLVRAGIGAQEDCHARTGAANAALIDRLCAADGTAAASLRANPAFVLPILMAAAATALEANACAIAAIGGNGSEFGLRQRLQHTWQQCPADAPRGPRFEAAQAHSALAAIGDSAVIDICGLGGQALAAAPDLAAEWAAWLPADALARRDALIDPHLGVVDSQRVLRAKLSPLINLAVLDRAGAAGLIGRGCYAVPLELFA